MKKLRMNKGGVTPVIATVVILFIVSAASITIMVFGSSHIESTRSLAQNAQVASEISAFTDTINNIVYNEPGTKSVSKFKLNEQSYLKTEEKTSRSVFWYSLFSGYDFDADVNDISNPNNDLTITMISGSVDRIVGMTLEDGRDTPCFLAGTKVLMADGTFKNIENIFEGEKVLVFDLESNNIITSSVLDVFHHDADVMTDYYLVINDDLCVTPNHRMYVKGEWVYAGDLNVGDCLFNGEKDIVITSIYNVFEKNPSFDIEIENQHNYFVKLNDDVVLVHNPAFGPLTASFTGVDAPCPPAADTAVYLDASSTNGGTSPYSYRWDFDNDGTYDYPLIQPGYTSTATYTHDYGDFLQHQCKLEVMDSSFPLNFDTDIKSVQATPGGPPPSGDAITVLKPDSSCVWIRGKAYDLEWDFSGSPDEEFDEIMLRDITGYPGVPDVEIYKYQEFSAFEGKIPEPADLDYEWGIPGDTEPGSNYQIYMTLRSDPTTKYWSEAFTIITGTPYLYYTPTTLSIDVGVNDITRGKYIYIKNTGTDRLTYTVTSSEPTWLTIRDIDGLFYDEVSNKYVDGCDVYKRHEIKVNSAGKPINTYTGNLDITSTDYLGNPVGSGTIEVTMNVKDVACLEVDPDRFDLFLEKGQSDQKVFYVWNGGLGYITYDVSIEWVNPNSPAKPWVEVSPISGSSYGEHDPIYVSIVNTSILNYGENHARIHIVNDSDSEIVDVYVTIQAVDPWFLNESSQWDPVTWYTGSVKDLKWDPDNNAGPNLKIMLYQGSYDNEIKVNIPLIIPNGVITPNVLNNDESYQWTIPYELPAGNDYWIKIVDLSNPDKYGRSNHFAVEAIGGYDPHDPDNTLEIIDDTMGLDSNGGDGDGIIESGETVTVGFSVVLEGVILIELWDDAAGLNRPIGRIMILDSDSVTCNSYTKDGYAKMIIENGGGIDENNNVKFSPVTHITMDSIGLRLTQMIISESSYTTMYGGELETKIHTNHIASYSREDVPSAYHLKFKILGENRDAWIDYLFNMYRNEDSVSLFLKTAEGNLLFRPSDPSDMVMGRSAGVRFSLMHSIVQFSMKI